MRFVALSSMLLLLVAHAFAGGSWLINGQRTEVVEVETSATDYNALYTDGSRSLNAPLLFGPAVSSPSSGLFKAYIPWYGRMGDFIIFDEGTESVRLSDGIAGFFPTPDLYIFGTTIGDDTGGGRIDLGEMSLKGGFWGLENVGPYGDSIITRDFAADHYVQSSVQNKHISLYCYADDPQQNHKIITIRAAAPGVGDVTATVDPEEGFVVDDQWGRAAKISSSSMRLGTNDTEIEILGSEVYLYPDATDPYHALNRRTGDARYIQRSEGITTNHTIQAGDVLQIQNGIITAINP